MIVAPTGIGLSSSEREGAVERQAALLLGRLVSTNRMFALVTASQMAAASAASAPLLGEVTGNMKPRVIGLIKIEMHH